MNAQPSITCPRCGRTSYHPGDIEHRYCGACHLFHDQLLDVLRAENGALRSLLADLFRHCLAEFELASEFDWTASHYAHPSASDGLFTRVETVLARLSTA